MIIESVVIVSNSVCMCIRENRLNVSHLFIVGWVGKLIAIQFFINSCFSIEIWQRSQSCQRIHSPFVHSNDFVAHAYHRVHCSYKPRTKKNREQIKCSQFGTDWIKRHAQRHYFQNWYLNQTKSQYFIFILNS